MYIIPENITIFYNTMQIFIAKKYLSTFKKVSLFRGILVTLKKVKFKHLKSHL